jgi:putative spermidine/putrescine transport system substrate-binding protein
MSHEKISQVYDSNASRRTFLKVLGLGGVSAAVFGMAACARRETAVLNVYGSGAITLDKWDRALTDLGLTIRYKDNGNDVGPVITQMMQGTAAQDFDLGCLQGGAEGELSRGGVILPWDLARIPNFSSLWSWAKDISYARVGGRQYGLPIVINADSMIYLPDRVGVIDSYGAVFDPKLKGRTSMEDAWINSAIFTAIYLKQNSLASIQDPGDLTADELGVVMEFLIKHKKDGQFRRFWNGWEDGLQLIRSQEVWVMTGWEPIVLAAQKAGVNAHYAVPKEGYEGWSNDLILHRGAEQHGLVPAAHQFANWLMSGYYGCAISELRGYVVPSDTAIDYARAHGNEFKVDKIQATLSHVRDKFLKQGGLTFWQNVRPRNYKLYEAWWSKLRAA